MGTLDFIKDGMSLGEILAACGERRHELIGQMQAMIDTAKKENRDFNDKESHEYDGLEAGLKTLDAKIEATEQAKARQDRQLAKLSQRIDNGLPFETLGVHTSSPAVRSFNTDSKGNRYAILNKGEKAASLYSKECDNAFGHFVLAKAFGPVKETPDFIRNALSTTDNTAGGFTVPNPLSGEVVDLARNKAVLGQTQMRTVMMESGTLTVPKLGQDVTISTKAENATLTFSDMAFGGRVLACHTAIAGTKVSRELYEDSTSLTAGQIGEWMAAAMAAQIDKWGIQGSGSQEPNGLLNFSGINETGSIGAIDWTDVAAAVTRLNSANHSPNAAIFNPTILNDLQLLETGDGTNSARGWLGAPPTLQGVQMLATNNMPLANAVVGDFSKYLMGVRTGAMVEASTEAGDAFASHQIWFKISMRMDFVTTDDSGFETLAGITS